jgi:hypothetical protein
MAKTRVAVPALVMGPAKSDDGDGDGPDEEESEGIPPDFEEAASRAFPELVDDPDRMQALYECVRSLVR